MYKDCRIAVEGRDGHIHNPVILNIQTDQHVIFEKIPTRRRGWGKRQPERFGNIIPSKRWVIVIWSFTEKSVWDSSVEDKGSEVVVIEGCGKSEKM